MNRYILAVKLGDANEHFLSSLFALTDRHALKAALAILDASEGGSEAEPVVMISLTRQEKNYP